MENKQIKTKGGIFRLLVTSYITFAVLLVISLFIALIASFVLFTGRDLAPFDPFALIDNPDSPSARLNEDMGMWLEGLDAHFQIVTIRGKKLDEAKRYTETEIFELLNPIPNKKLNSFQGFIRPAEEGEVSWWLVKQPLNNVKITYNIELNASNIYARYFFVFVSTFTLLFILNCFIISKYLSRKINEPLKVLSFGMEKIRNGDENVFLEDFKSKTEFDDIRDSFNYMSQKLYEETQTRELNESRKNRLLTDLSHDIKTPVATIKAYANALAEGLVKEEKHYSYLKAIDSKADRVSCLADDLFTVLSLDNITFKPENTDIAELFRKLCVSVIDEIEAKGLLLKVDIPEDIINATVDVSLLSRAIENLLNNAIKYNTAGSFIRASIIRVNDRIVLSVSDDGAEIPVECRDTIFDAFIRADKSRSSTGGTGLGLAICAGIVKRHGGSLTYSRENAENVFCITLPYHIPFSP